MSRLPLVARHDSSVELFGLHLIDANPKQPKFYVEPGFSHKLCEDVITNKKETH